MLAAYSSNQASFYSNTPLRYSAHTSCLGKKMAKQSRPWTVVEKDTDKDGRLWYVIRGASNLQAEDDEIVLLTVDQVLHAYKIQSLFPEPDQGASCNFSFDGLNAIFREGLPDPDDPNELHKPEQLRIVRSEAAEIFSQVLIHKEGEARFPFSTHAGKTNPNDPLKGFDGVGLTEVNGKVLLVLLEVKASDDAKSPPGVSKSLIGDCKKAFNRQGTIIRTLTLYYHTASIQLKDQIGSLLKRNRDKEIIYRVLPIIVRGHVEAKRSDLKDIERKSSNLPDEVMVGVTVSLGADLNEFGARVFKLARSNDA